MIDNEINSRKEHFIWWIRELRKIIRTPYEDVLPDPNDPQDARTCTIDEWEDRIALAKDALRELEDLKISFEQQEDEDIFIRKATNEEVCLQEIRNEGFKKILERDGYNIAYQTYGRPLNIWGFYYSKDSERDG